MRIIRTRLWVLPTGLDLGSLMSDLMLQWNVFGGGLALKGSDIIVPEPATLRIIAMAAFGLISRRRRRP